MDIKGKAAVVTGASRGVGKATALLLASRGCSVLVNFSRSKEEAEQAVQEVRRTGVKAVGFQADVSDDDACRAMMEAARTELGSLDILVNNAGTTEFIPHAQLDEVTDEVWRRLLDVNLKGAFQCTRAARGHMESAGAGEVVNVTSIAGITGSGSSIPYCASKAAEINLTISLARVLGPKIRVNSVAPGFIAGSWTQKGLGENYESAKAKRSQRAVLGRVCTPEDVAAAIAGIIAGSDMVTGQTVICDGGDLIGPQVGSM